MQMASPQSGRRAKFFGKRAPERRSVERSAISGRVSCLRLPRTITVIAALEARRRHPPHSPRRWLPDSRSMVDEALAGRSYAQVYRVQGRRDLHAYLIDGVERAGGDVLYAS